MNPLESHEANKFTMRNLAIEEYLEFTNQDHSEGREALDLLLDVIDAHISWMLAQSELDALEASQ